MRLASSAAVLALLAACAPPPHLQPQGGVGFGDYSAYGAAPQTAYGAPAAATPPGGIPSSEINSALFGTPTAPGTAAAAPATAPALTAPAGTAGAPAVAATGHASISDEQDFSAVSSRETIETDKARIEANKAQYQVIAPTALPERTGDTQASELIDYALNAPNRLGQAMYERRSVSTEAHQAACLRYPTPEAAQQAFLKSGGPKRDPKKLDPDGDGFACSWDPTPFQAARGN